GTGRLPPAAPPPEFSHAARQAAERSGRAVRRPALLAEITGPPDGQWRSEGACGHLRARPARAAAPPAPIHPSTTAWADPGPSKEHYPIGWPPCGFTSRTFSTIQTANAHLPGEA